jgi:hypothetical protein
VIAPLPRFQQSEYGPVAERLRGVKYRQPSRRGWGPGWPNCQTDRVHEYTVNRVTLRVRDEIAELVTYLVAASNAMGYDIRRRADPSGGVGSFACRKVGGTNVASIHSWGLAVDQNTKGNPLGSRFISVTPPSIVNLWESCGFAWLGRGAGPGRFDCMHFDYQGRPEDVATDLLTAQTMVPTRYPFTHEGQYLPSMVRVLQHRLEVHGFPVPDEGEWTPEYTTAVKAFQKAKGIRIDALVGAVTWGELNADPVDEHAEPEDDE